VFAHCVQRPRTDWIWHWTIGDVIEHFFYCPHLFRLLDPGETVADYWQALTVEMQRQLEGAFVLYDIEHHV
jgi:hypothetical protein